MSVSSLNTIDYIYSLRVDQADTDTLYVGESPIGSLESNAVWRIKRVLTNGTITTLSWADGNQYFDNVWDNRLTLTYI